MSKNVFEVGHTYTRHAIHQAVGGNLRYYLPHRQGRVVCGCFTPPQNPAAPDVVLVGDGPKIISSAKMFAGQSEAVPTFIKHEANAWEYVGHFSVDRYSNDPAEIATHSPKHVDRPVVGVLFLRKVA